MKKFRYTLRYNVFKLQINKWKHADHTWNNELPRVKNCDIKELRAKGILKT